MQWHGILMKGPEAGRGAQQDSQQDSQQSVAMPAL